MNELPEDVERSLVRQLVRTSRNAMVRTDAQGCVLECRGDLEWFGLGGIDPGARLEEHFIALHALGGSEGPESIPRIELVPGRSTDLHLIRSGSETTVFLLDATAEAERELQFQRRGNQLGLMLRSLGVATFEISDEDELVLLNPEPQWMRALLGGDDDIRSHFPFVENFLVDAQEVWSGRVTGPASSGHWTEEDDRGREWSLEATATRLEDGRKILLIQTVTQRIEEHRHILQEARSKNLDFDRLRRETDKKEVLLHCIVHDLKGPLSSMVGSMSLIKSRDLAPERARELLELGLDQARAQEAMIRGILEAFAAEIESLEHFESDPTRAPDLLACLGSAVETYRPAFEQAGASLDARVAPDLATGEQVVGEEGRLVRVFCNLLENALRISPRGGGVRLQVERATDGFRVLIEDDGPGVPKAEQEALFDKLSRGTMSSGMAGLGLHFCSSTLARWGGSIAYRDAESGGACFVIELRAAR